MSLIVEIPLLFLSIECTLDDEVFDSWGKTKKRQQSSDRTDTRRAMKIILQKRQKFRSLAGKILFHFSSNFSLI
jgi:hypothetical protein